MDKVRVKVATDEILRLFGSDYIKKHKGKSTLGIVEKDINNNSQFFVGFETANEDEESFNGWREYALVIVNQQNEIVETKYNLQAS